MEVSGRIFFPETFCAIIISIIGNKTGGIMTNVLIVDDEK